MSGSRIRILSTKARTGVKTVLSATERREEILEILSDRRSETVAGLAVQSSVSERTIRRDLAMLSRFSPIFTVQGRGGGIFVVDGWYIGRRYLRASQDRQR